MICIRPIAFLAMLCVALAAGAQDSGHSNAGHYERVVVHGKSLEGNLSADTPDRQVSVYLPPGYAKETRRYPVIYLLHGFTDSDARWFGLEGKHFVHVPRAVDAARANGVGDTIVVMPNAFTRFQGSMYSSSVAIGDWERFITRELVEYVDAHYRTLARPESRGLAGHSMGGYGTMRLAMKAPGVFSSIYAMSPCCMNSSQLPPVEFVERAAKIHDAQGVTDADFLTKAMLASAAAWSPNPKNPPFFLDLPLVDGKLAPGILAEWSANSPNLMLHQYIPALRSYRAMAIDAGDKDAGIAAAVTELHGLLEAYGIVHGYEIYDGDHVNHIEERLVKKVFPFFDQQLQR